MTAGKLHLPTWDDVKHLPDYIVYRLTRNTLVRGAGPDRPRTRPMYLSPDLGVRVPIPRPSAMSSRAWCRRSRKSTT